jgi:hypothetical protein
MSWAFQHTRPTEKWAYHLACALLVLYLNAQHVATRVGYPRHKCRSTDEPRLAGQVLASSMLICHRRSQLAYSGGSPNPVKWSKREINYSSGRPSCDQSSGYGKSRPEVRDTSPGMPTIKNSRHTISDRLQLPFVSCARQGRQMQDWCNLRIIVSASAEPQCLDQQRSAVSHSCTIALMCPGDRQNGDS